MKVGGRLSCKVPTCSSVAIWGSVSCPRILWIAARGAGDSSQRPSNYWITLPPELQPWTRCMGDVVLVSLFLSVHISPRCTSLWCPNLSLIDFTWIGSWLYGCNSVSTLRNREFGTQPCSEDNTEHVVWGQMKEEAENLSQLWFSWSRWVLQLCALWQDDPCRAVNLTRPTVLWLFDLWLFLTLSLSLCLSRSLFLYASLSLSFPSLLFTNCLREIRQAW